MSTTILSFQNRVVIETLHNEGRSLRYIANYLGFSKTTIFNELHRLNSEYQAELVQTDFEQKVSQHQKGIWQGNWWPVERPQYCDFSTCFEKYS